MIHVCPVATDGDVTIGYDANGVAGTWPGNMTETCESREFVVAEYDYFSLTQFDSVNDCYDLCITDSGELVWRDGAYNWTPIRDVLKKFGDL
jgi:hypothetical protein